jgi:NAD(P)-dependent dehydrogenase (short-subunit alcohol dehydrogenase family)
MEQLDGRVAIITGGSKGIGRGMANAYAKAGAAVAVTGRTQTALDETEADLQQIPGAKAISVCADGMNEEAVRETVDRVLARFGRVDVLVNCAQTFGRQAPL